MYQRGTQLGYCAGAAPFIGDSDGNSYSQTYFDPDGQLLGPEIVVTAAANAVVLSTTAGNVNQNCGNLLYIGPAVGFGGTAVTLTKIFL